MPGKGAFLLSRSCSLGLALFLKFGDSRLQNCNVRLQASTPIKG